MEHVAEGQENNWGLLKGVLEEVRGSKNISQTLNSVIVADLRRRSHRPHSARRTRSKFAILWPRSG